MSTLIPFILMNMFPLRIHKLEYKSVTLKAWKHLQKDIAIRLSRVFYESLHFASFHSFTYGALKSFSWSGQASRLDAKLVL